MHAMIASIVTCIVGCNSGAPDKQALHVLACDTETGAAKIVQSVKGIEGTTYFAIDGEKKNLYSMISENGKGALVKFALDGHALGAMTKLCDLPCETPCHVSLTPDEKRVAFAAYSSATCGTVGIDGRDLRTFVFPNDDMGDNRNRQQKAFAHQTFHLDPAGVGHGEMGVVDLGCDRIWFFDAETMQRKDGLEIKAAAGAGPRHALCSNDGRFLFVLNELASTVASYALEQPLAFRKVGEWSMLPADLMTAAGPSWSVPCVGETPPSDMASPHMRPQGMAPRRAPVPVCRPMVCGATSKWPQ